MTITTEKRLDAIKAGLTECRLLERAAADCAEALFRFAVLNRTPREAISILANWQRTFEKLGRHK